MSPLEWRAVPPTRYSPTPGIWRLHDHDDWGVLPSKVVMTEVGAWARYEVEPPPPPPPPPPPEDWVYVMNEDFSAWSTPMGGTPTASEVNSRLGMGTNNTGSAAAQKCTVSQTLLNQYVRIVDGGGDRGKVWSMLLPANSGSSNKGATIWCNMPNPQNVVECILEYDLRFRGATPDLPFGPEWGYGGKLFGMGGVIRSSSPGQPSGCKDPSDVGWSGRQMWWGKNAAGKAPYSAVGARTNLGVHYSYDWLRRDRCGDNLTYSTDTSSASSFQDRTWHTIKIHYKLNTPGSANGLLRVSLDGRVVRQVTNWQPRARADLYISHLWMHCFRGGNDSLWAVSRNTRVDFDRIRISRPK